ncbi:MAG: Crp/Fnr family transcriptional regulator [Bacteroidota bacterium]
MNDKGMIRAYLEAVGGLAPQDIDALLACAKPVHLKKYEYLIQIGEKAERIGFVLNGILRSYYYADNADEITYCMLFPESFVSAYSSLITGKPTEECIQAITDVELLTISKGDLYRLAEGNIRIINFMRIMAEQAYVEQEERIFRLQRSSAQERYNKLLAEQPDYLQQIPLRYLASYLGVTQRHLSRIRSQLTK